MTNTNNTAAAIAAEIIATTETRIELRAAERPKLRFRRLDRNLRRLLLLKALRPCCLQGCI